MRPTPATRSWPRQLRRRAWRACVLPLCLPLIAAGLARAVPAAQVSENAPRSVTSRLNDVADALSKAQVVFVGEVASVGAPPRARTSSKALATQPVEYRVLQVLEGTLPRELLARFTVRHGILASAPYVEPSVEAPGALRLSPAVFAPGARLIVMANELQAPLRLWHLTDVDVGVWPATDQNLAEITRLLGAR